MGMLKFSSPLSGTFFNQQQQHGKESQRSMFSSPLSGTFFNQPLTLAFQQKRVVFVPFIGDFFQSVLHDNGYRTAEISFRPLYRGLFSIYPIP